MIEGWTIVISLIGLFWIIMFSLFESIIYGLVVLVLRIKPRRNLDLGYSFLMKNIFNQVIIRVIVFVVYSIVLEVIGEIFIGSNPKEFDYAISTIFDSVIYGYISKVALGALGICFLFNKYYLIRIHITDTSKGKASFPKERLLFLVAYGISFAVIGVRMSWSMYWV
ncbi:hypothetical protein GCM10008018_64880 [Paenibacillus marchantiophytorum]|uniref:Uncharacterized protein n=1 Tax=Paenibacillus marchantiophytorum TaxID=1619310 RepID=A0ABQ1FFB2_9BACL|nr:hypothetical protein [Paenibacillus marchantiophytorum]GGA10572.1 hypothetical protein GCM10008018_64880 [Paenibacillus marchantiophytorum]